MSEIKRITPGSKADLARRMADRRRELIARPLAEIWEELAAVAMDGSDVAPSAPPCVMSDETKEALGVAIAFFDREIRKKNEAMAECQNFGQEIYVRNLFSQRKSLERHQLLIQQVVTGHPSRSAAIAAEPVYPREAIARILDPRPTGPAGWAYTAADLALKHAAPATEVEPVATPTASPEPDWKQDQAETSRLPRNQEASPEPDAVRKIGGIIAKVIYGGTDLGDGFHMHKTADLDKAKEAAAAVLAALSRPAHRGWEDISKQMKLALAAWDEDLDGKNTVRDGSAMADAIRAFLSRNDRVTSQPDTDGGPK